MCKQETHKKVNNNLDRPIITNGLDQSLWNDKCDYIDIESCKNLNPNNYNLAVMQINIRSILSKQVQLKQLLRQLENKNSQVDIILLCKTFLSKNTSKLLQMPGYQIFTDSRQDHKGGDSSTCQRRHNMQM